MDPRLSSASDSFGELVSNHGHASSQALFSEDSQGLFDATHDDRDHSSNRRVVDHGSVVERIEDIVESVVDAMSENRPLTIPLRSRYSGNEFVVSFPSTNATGIKKFGGFCWHSSGQYEYALCLTFFSSFPAAFLQVLFLCRQALVSGTVITKRSVLLGFLSRDYQR